MGLRDPKEHPNGSPLFVHPICLPPLTPEDASGPMTQPTPPALINKVRITLARHAMCTRGDHLLIALSGGADSMALLHILHALAPSLEITLAVAHLNHGIRGDEARRDQEFSRNAAQALSLDFYTREVDVPALAQKGKIGMEEAARQARYAFLHDVAKTCGATRIAVGHHKGDIAELLLLNLMRGSGLKGLGGMDPITPNGVIRPLMDLSRTEITIGLEAMGVPHITDTTNSDTAYTRNRVRHRLIPLMAQEFNPSIVETLARTADLLRDEEAWIESITQDHYEACLLEHNREDLIISIPRLSVLHPAAQKRVLRYAVRVILGSTRTLTSAHALSLVQLVKKGNAGHYVDLSRGLRGVLTEEGLHLSAEGKNLRTTRPGLLTEAPPFEYTVESIAPDCPLTLPIPETGDSLSFRWVSAPTPPLEPHRNALRVVVGSDAIGFPLTIRNSRPGDRFRPSGGEGTRKIGRFLGDCHVPAHDRPGVPLVISLGTILWVAGHRLDASVTPPEPGTPALEIVFQKCKKGVKPSKGSGLCLA